MQRTYLSLLLLVLAIVAGWLLVDKETKKSQSPAKKVVENKERTLGYPPSSSRAATSPPTNPELGISGHPDALAFGTDAFPPEREASILLELLEVYRRQFGTFPTGNENAHFMNALAGSNSSGLVIFPLTHPRISTQGELLDAWANPFHFHLIDRHHLEVRSAGQDGELFTSDDITTPPRRSP